MCAKPNRLPITLGRKDEPSSWCRASDVSVNHFAGLFDLVRHPVGGPHSLERQGGATNAVIDDRPGAVQVTRQAFCCMLRSAGRSKGRHDVRGHTGIDAWVSASGNLFRADDPEGRYRRNAAGNGRAAPPANDVAASDGFQ
jgi:hypothetical protein